MAAASPCPRTRPFACAGIATFLWLHTILAKANDVVRKQTALKADRSRRRCISLAVLMLAHIGISLLVLRSQQLWRNFLLISTSASQNVGCPCH